MTTNTPTKTRAEKEKCAEKIEYLSGYLRLNRQINEDIEELTRLREAATGINCRNRGRVKSSQVQNRLERTVEKIVLMQSRINREIDELVDTRLYLEQCICELSDRRLGLLLKYRYIDGKPWKEISDLLYLEPESKQIYKLHQRAIEEIDLT